MTQRDEILATIREHLPSIAAFDVQALMVFGSVARGEDTPDSDVDVLVQFDGPPTFDHFMDLKFLLEDALGRRVDLVTTTGLREELREHVLAEALRVA